MKESDLCSRQWSPLFLSTDVAAAGAEMARRGLASLCWSRARVRLGGDYTTYKFRLGSLDGDDIGVAQNHFLNGLG